MNDINKNATRINLSAKKKSLSVPQRMRAYFITGILVVAPVLSPFISPGSS